MLKVHYEELIGGVEKIPFHLYEGNNELVRMKGTNIFIQFKKNWIFSSLKPPSTLVEEKTRLKFH
jgi:hypothetical protein